MNSIDALFDSVAQRGPVCVGLDTAASYIPPSVLAGASSVAEAVWQFNKALIDATYDAVACFKVQIAYYEALGTAGLATFSRTLRYIKEKNALSIADIKRGDIADTAKQYATAFFNGEFEADFVTLAPYMGMDSIQPWLEAGTQAGKGAFVLMRTSNPGMKDFQYQELKTGKRLYDVVGERMADLAAEHHGQRGYGDFGIVVGCTEKEEAADIRKKYPHLFFLIPGYGTQGGAGEDAARLLIKGNGGVVNASRSIQCAWKKNEPHMEN
jgi:orotidine-5'-phosphate decarboxylase